MDNNLQSIKVNLEQGEKASVSFIAKIKKIRKLGGIQFLEVFDQSGSCQIVLDHKVDANIVKGDFIYCSGVLCRNKYGQIEVFADKVFVVGSSNKRNAPLNLNDKFDKLIVRSRVIEELQYFFKLNDVLPVSSPTIVGDWVDGKTNSFEVNYFGDKAYLTLNNMLYHQVLLISGYSRIYEISKIFRQDNSSPKNRLAEFYSLDISFANKDMHYMMDFVEKMITYIIDKNILPNIDLEIGEKFPTISVDDLIEKSGCGNYLGSQIPSKARKYLNDHYKGFLWLTNSKEEKRRFFVKSINGKCNDYQLWYKGEVQIAAGSERESDIEKQKERIIIDGKKIEQYENFLRYFENGVPEMCEIGFGLERFLMYITNSLNIYDYVAFPRNGKKIII